MNIHDLNPGDTFRFKSDPDNNLFVLIEHSDQHSIFFDANAGYENGHILMAVFWSASVVLVPPTLPSEGEGTFHAAN